MTSHAIVDRGRGPEIAGSRITVYDVLAETRAGATPEQLAEWYQLDVEAIRLALRYIDDNKERVESNWANIQERHARGNPPELQATLDAIHEKHAPRWEALKRRGADGRNGDARPAGGHQHSEACRDLENPS